MSARHTALGVGMFVLLFLAAAAFWFHDETEGVQEPPQTVSAPHSPQRGVVTRNCPEGLTREASRYARDVTCGSIEVSESSRSQALVQLEIRRFSPSPSPSLPPLLLLAGGPGDAWISGARSRLELLFSLAKKRELLLIDLRGTGESRPNLSCGPSLGKDVLRRCFRDWDAERDLSAYQTDNHVQDLFMALDALRVPRVAVYGVSYGAHLALSFASKFPKRVSSLVLDSPVVMSSRVLHDVGLNKVRVIRDLLSECRKRAPCSRLLKGRSLEPLLEEIHSVASKQAAQFLENLSSILYSPTALRFVPWLLQRATKGDFLQLNQWVDSAGGSDFSLGLHLSVQCAEGFEGTRETFSRADQELGISPAFLGEISANKYVGYCAAWAVRPSARTPGELRSDVRALVLSGDFDSVTPPTSARDILTRLSSGRLATAPATGHGVAFDSCGAQVVADFLNQGDELEGCLAKRVLIPAVSGPTSKESAQVVRELKERL